MVTKITGLHALFCCNVSYELCGIVMVQNPFDLDEQFWEKGFLALPKDFSGYLQDAAQFPAREHVIEGT